MDVINVLCIAENFINIFIFFSILFTLFHDRFFNEFLYQSLNFNLLVEVFRIFFMQTEREDLYRIYFLKEVKMSRMEALGYRPTSRRKNFLKMVTLGIFWDEWNLSLVEN